MRWVTGALLTLALAGPALAQHPGPPETELFFGGFGGTLQRAMQSNVMRAFQEATGIHVTYVTATSNQLLAKVRGQGDHPQLDVLWGTETSHFQGRKLGVFAKLDPAIVMHLDELFPSARTADDLGVVMGMQALAIEYNTEAFRQHEWAPPSSLRDLWDARFKGHVVCYNLPGGYAVGFLGFINKLAGGSAGDLSPGWARMRALTPNVMAFVDTPAQLDDLLAGGEAWITYNGSGRISDLAATGVPVAMAIPKEGALANPDFFDLVRHAPHPTAAQRFINFALSAPMQEVIARTMSLAPMNGHTVLDPVTARRLDFGLGGVEGLSHIDMDALSDKIDQLTQKWAELVAHK